MSAFTMGNIQAKEDGQSYRVQTNLFRDSSLAVPWVADQLQNSTGTSNPPRYFMLCPLSWG